MKKHPLQTVLCIVPLLAILAGCAGAPVKTLEQDPFEDRLNALINGLISSQALTFRLVPRDEGRLNVYFDGGFK